MEQSQSVTDVNVVVLLFAGVTQLDYVGPVEVLGRCPNTRIYLASRESRVTTDQDAVVLSTGSLSDAPPASVLIVPGGPGSMELLADREILTFVRAQAYKAAWVCSVCTGAFILGAAGLIRGRRATTHWASLPMLAELGAHPVEDRVVIDRPLATAAGVSAGIDLALTLAGEIYGSRRGASIELAIEYDPMPPFGTGAVSAAPSNWLTRGRDAMRSERLDAVRRAGNQLA
jgi:cyclohexyl-isocyanide hydratase